MTPACRRPAVRPLLATSLSTLILVAALAPREAGAATGSAGTRQLNVFAAASLTDAFGQLASILRARHPEFDVRFNFAGSQQLVAQLEQGANADVLAAADERWMDEAVKQDLTAGDPVVFATNRLVVIVPRTNPARIDRLQHLARRGIKLVLGAESVPVGRYSREVLRNLSRDPAFGNQFARQVLANLVSEEENVKSVVGKVQLGEADAGIVYQSDVTRSVRRFVRVIEIPEQSNVLARYPIAILKDARDPEAAHAFVELAQSPEGQRVLGANGFLPASGPAR